MTKKQIFLTIPCSIILFLFIRSVIIVHLQSSKEIQPGYFVGKIVDLGTECGRRSCYRWIIADWITLDGEHVSTREINAAGKPINILKKGDTIKAQGSLFLPGFFWFKVACGIAYYPSQISIVNFIIITIFQFLLWIMVIYIGYRIYKSLNKGK